jgi:hypothetical protein
MSTIIDHVKKWWVLHSALIMSMLYWFVPSVQSWVSKNPKSTFAGILGYLVIALLKQSPVSKAAVLLLMLLLPSFASAQTPTPPPDPTNYITITGSALGFRDSYTDSVAASSEMGAALQITKRVSFGYDQVTVPAANRVYRYGVINYTIPLDTLLGKKLASKFVFDASAFNVIFKAGGGKLAQTAPSINLDVITETAGMYVVHKLMGPVSLMVGGQWLHGGKNPSNAAFTTGLSLSF